MVVLAGGDFDQRDALIERVRHRPVPTAQQAGTATPAGPAPSCWTLRTIRASLPGLQDYTLSGVWRVVQRCGLRLRSARLRMYSPDAAYVTKEAYLLRCLQGVAQAPTTRVLLFLDEMGYTRWPEAARVWGSAPPQAPPSVERVDTNTQWRLVGALNALTGQVDYLDNYIVGRKQLITFYEQLHQRYGDAERIYIVQDNWSIHRHAEVLDALQHWPRIVPVWLPTYAPWLNPIEKLWRWLRQDVLKLHRLSSDWRALRQQVRSFLDQFRTGSQRLLHYVGLVGEGKLAHAIRSA